ncbi:hypothetical protein L1987_47851 [Smallanthus sonchifolius]|uniref:Uncharacterized protein n=1 Tax=Smallanthus sonchifolius TaxID=185202 RepID=A0ACB9FR64_9ASTR|nr:hypothetical protein L1987_47851 [Smallanthus sonchifolius]
MKGRFCRVVIIMMCIMRGISRPLGSNDGPSTFSPTKQGTETQIVSSRFNMPSKSVSSSRFLTKDEEKMKNEDERYEGGIENRIGSRPPSCEHKCYGCSPCEATQVPTTSRVGIQYTNYEPEGWKCKCGPSLYSP